VRQGALLRAVDDRVRRSEAPGHRETRREHARLLNAVVDNPAERRYEIRVDGELAGKLEYRREAGAVDLFHTEVEPGLRNRGLGAVLVRDALDDLRARGDRVIPTCPFVAAFIRRNAEYEDLVA
jgi:predicted GNAT family acetyltransferase